MNGEIDAEKFRALLISIAKRSQNNSDSIAKARTSQTPSAQTTDGEMESSEEEEAATVVNKGNVAFKSTHNPDKGEKSLGGSVYQQATGYFGRFEKDFVKQCPLGVKNQFVNNDIAYLKSLAGSPHIHRLIKSGTVKNLNVVVMERYVSNLREVMDNGEWDRFDKQMLFGGTIRALTVLESWKILHRDLRPKNIAVVEFNGEFRSVLTGFKYATSQGGATSGRAFTTTRLGERKEDFAPRTRGTDYSHTDDRYAVACVMCCFAVKTNKQSKEYPLKLDWKDTPGEGYREAQFRHLAKVIFKSCKPDYAVGLSDFFHHPFFWTLEEMSNFEKRMRSFVSPKRNRSIDLILEKGRATVYSGDWIKAIGNAAMEKFIEANRKNREPEKFMNLWMVRVNRQLHRFEDPPHIREIIGFGKDDDFEYWETRFPHFILYIFCVIAGHRPKPAARPWFRHEELKFFFPARAAFYALCIDTRIKAELSLPTANAREYLHSI